MRQRVAQERDWELAAAARCRVPGRVSLPSGRVPSLAPTPWGGESRVLPLRQGHRQSACVSTTSGSIWEVVRRNGTFRGEPCLEEVVSRLRWALPSVKESAGRVGSCIRRRIRQIPIRSLRSGAGGEWVGARLRESDQDLGIQRSRSETWRVRRGSDKIRTNTAGGWVHRDGV